MSEQMQQVAARYEKATGKKFDQKTNADHIRSMTDDELAEWLADIDCNNCDCCVYQMECRFEHDTETVNYAEKYCCFTGRVDWLKQPYKEDT
jgi:hypothetical protein